MAFTLKTRPPTGRVPWPLILVEGAEKAGKSWAAAVLSASPRVGRTFWIDLGEGAGDEYGAIPGARYEIVEHDGTWHDIIGAVEAVRDYAKTVPAGQPPAVLVIDSMTAVWDMLKDWASNRARSTPANRKLLAADPNAEITVTANFWNDANARHRRLMTILMTFPGIAVVTARGKDVTAMTNGQPDARKPREYRVEGHKDLAFDATVWLRLSRTEHPTIVGARSVHAGIQPASDKPKTVPGLELDRLIFDVLRCNPAEAAPRDLVDAKPGDDAPPPDRTEAARTRQEARAAARDEEWDAAAPARPANGHPTAEADAARQHAACEQFIEKVKAAKTPEDIETAGQLVKDARGAGRITQAHYDRISRAAAHRLGQLKQPQEVGA